MRYAQIVIGVKGHGKSTYCNLMSNYGESQGRVMKIGNLDPRAESSSYLDSVSVTLDIRDKVSADDYEEAESDSELGIGGGFDFVLKYILDNPDWFSGAIEGDDETTGGDTIIFDCPGQDFHAHLNNLQEFGALLLSKDFRVCVVFVQDARLSTDGYSYISTCFTPLISSMSLSLPHINIMMKVDLLTDEDKSKILLFMASEIKEVLCYEINQRGGKDPVLDQVAQSAVTLLDGDTSLRKHFLLDVREEQELQSVLTIIDDCFLSTEDDEDDDD